MLFWNNDYSPGLADHVRPVRSAVRPASAECYGLGLSSDGPVESGQSGTVHRKYSGLPMRIYRNSIQFNSFIVSTVDIQRKALLWQGIQVTIIQWQICTVHLTKYRYMYRERYNGRYIHVYIYTYIYMYIYIHTQRHIYTHIRIYTHIHSHIYIHIHIYAYTFELNRSNSDNGSSETRD